MKNLLSCPVWRSRRTQPELPALRDPSTLQQNSKYNVCHSTELGQGKTEWLSLLGHGVSWVKPSWVSLSTIDLQGCFERACITPSEAADRAPAAEESTRYCGSIGGTLSDSYDSLWCCNSNTALVWTKFQAKMWAPWCLHWCCWKHPEWFTQLHSQDSGCKKRVIKSL